MSANKFDIVILNGRPAAGKSEVIDYLKKTPLEERIRRFHIGEFEEFDDFPILWERFEDDDLWQQHGYPRLISDDHFEVDGQRHAGYVFKELFFWHWLLQKLSQNYARRLRDKPSYHDTHTAVFEFARGSQHGGFAEGYPYLSDQVLQRACTIYINVPWEESLRKNRRRYNPDKPDSILQHALEDKKMEMLYKESDWETFSAPDPSFLSVRGMKIPYAVFDNMPEKTLDPSLLGPELERVCSRLWSTHQSR